MKLRLLAKYGYFFIFVSLFAGVATLWADTCSWPVSVAVPTGMAGELDSLPVSVGIPTGMAGELDSLPVSVGIPTGMSGELDSQPASVAIKSANLGDPYLVGLWHMDGDWGDSSGNGNNGTPYGGVGFTTTLNDKAIGTSAASLNGTDGYIRVSNSPSLNPTNQITVAAWYKPQSFSGSGNDPIVDKGYTSHIIPYYQYHLGVSGDQFTGNPATFNFSVAVGGASYGVSTARNFWITGNWYYIVGTYDGSAVKLYVNGVLIGSPMPVTGAMIDYGKDVYFGRFSNLNYFLPGKIDDVTIYKRALAAEEIAVQYAAGVNDPLAPPRPILYQVPAVIGTNSIALSGTKVANTSIWVNNWKVAFANTSTAWHGTYGPPQTGVQPGLQAGLNILNVRAMDTSYRVSQPTTATVIYDPLLPTITQPASPTNNASITLTGTKAANSYLYVNNTLITSVPFANTSWGCPITLATEGTNTISVYAKDSAGNQSHTVSVSVVLDTTSAAFSNISMLSNLSYTNDQALNFSGTLSDVSLSQVTVSVDNQGQVVTQSVPVQNGAFNSAVQLRVGTNLVTITATDPAGNVTNVTPRTIYFDNNTPVITIDTPADNSTTKVSTVTVTGSVDRPATVTVGGNAATTTMDGAKSNFSATVDLGTPGSHQIDVVATDLNNHSSSQKRTVTYDSIKPQLAITVPGQDLVTRNAVVTVSATVSGADPVTVTSTFNGVTTPLTLDNGTYSFSVNFSTLVQGIYPITVTANDVAGNASTATRTIIFNTAGPSLTVDALPTDTGTANITLTGTVGANATVTVFNTATDSSVPAAVTDGLWSYPVTLAPGPNTFMVQALDAFGNPTTKTGSITYMLPASGLTINPVAPYVNQPTPVISGTVDAGATVSVSVNGAPALAATVSNSTWSCQLAGLLQGLNNSVTVTAVKPNSYPATANASFIWDTVAPTKPVITATPTSPTISASGTISGTKDANSYLYLSSNQLLSVPLADVEWHYDVTLNAGSNTFTLFARDEAGNQSPTSTTVTVVRDLVAPTIDTTSPAKTAFVSGADTISVTLTDVNQGVAGAGADLQASWSGAVVKRGTDVVTGTWSVSGSSIVFAPQTLPLPDGSYTITIYPVDTLGNKGSASFGFTLDRAPPTVASFTMSPSSPVKAGDVTFTVLFGELMDISVSPALAIAGPVNPVLKSSGWLADGKTWSGVYTFAAASDGAYTVTASGAKDRALNPMTQQPGPSFVVDTIAPTVPTLAAVTSPTKITTQTLTGTKLAGTAIIINNIQRVALNDATTWSYSYPLLEGANNLTIVARDMAGNDSTSVNPTPVITLDSTPPLFTIDNYKTPANEPTQTISGRKEPGCIVKLNGTQIFGQDDQNATWTYLVTLIEGMTNHLVFTAADSLGNPTTKAIDILYDSAPPVALSAGMLVADGTGKGTTATLTWPSYIEPVDLAYYRIYVAPADFTSFTGLTAVGTVNKGTKTFTVTGLTKDTIYYFAVVPVDGSGNFETVFHTAQATPTDTVAPEDVTGLAAWAGYNTADSNYITLTWNASANSAGDLKEQVVYVDAGQGYDAGTIIDKGLTTFKKGSLTDATLYKFKVTVRDMSSHESSGAVVQGATRLANPTGLAAVPGNGKVTLTWNVVSSPYVKLYNVYRFVSSSTQTDVGTMSLIRSQSGANYTDTGLTNGTTYQYAVTVVNASSAERTGIQSISAAPRGDTTGPVISNLTVTANQVITAPFTISASAADAESTMGRLELYIDDTLVTTQNGGSLSYSWSVVDTTDGNHTVKVVAYDSLNNPTEISVPVVVSLALPAVPVITTTFNGPITQNAVTISGTAPLNSSVTLKINGVVLGQPVAVAANGTFTFSNVALVEGDNLLAVKAANRGGESIFSPDYRITVDTGAPNQPINLMAKLFAGGSLQLSWQHGAGEIPTGFNLYESTTSFTTITASAVRKVNATPILYTFKDYIPTDDAQHFYAVTALDGAGNESAISGLVSIASDRVAPSISEIRFVGASGQPAADGIYGPGAVNVSFKVNEPLKELPYFGLEPQTGLPIVVTLQKIDETHYGGSFTIDASSANGTTVYKFSGKDLVGNRGNSSGPALTIDAKGPVAEILSPLNLLQTTAGITTVTLAFDEPSVITPMLDLKGANGVATPVIGLVSHDNGLHWSGSVDPSAIPDGNALFILSASKDRFSNSGTTIKTGASILLYATTPPAPAVPEGLTANPAKGGAVNLAWNRVTDAQGYNIYRKGGGDTAPLLIHAISTNSSITYVDIPSVDGTYLYSVSAVGLLTTESARSAEVSAVADRTAPAAPSGIALTLTGNGVQASWTPGTGEASASYRLYRSEAAFTTMTGLTAVASTQTTTATDPAPISTKRFYAVTALDALGNESAPSAAQEITFPVAPVNNLLLVKVDDGKPTLSWSAAGGIQGYYIYRNGSRINDVVTLSAAYTDGYYAGGAVTYAVSVLDSLGNESPKKEVTLPALSIGLKEGTTLRRGVLENVAVVATLPAGTNGGVTISTIKLKIGALAESMVNGPFSVTAAAPLEVQKVAATEATAPTQVAVVATAVLNPAPGTTVEISRSSVATVIGSGTALEVFNEPLVRGTVGKVRIKVNNLGSARMDFLTSESNGPTSQVKVSLKDQDGNILAQGNLNQRTGAVVNSVGYATARIEPGGSFLSDPITFTIPSAAPDQVVIEAVISTTYYHYNQPEQVTAPGLKQSLATIIANVAYNALAITDKAVYKQGEPVVITGSATSTTTSQPMPLVPIKIGLSVNGFDRFFTVTTDQTGAFSYTFTPGSNEAGSYNVWASHPDLNDRTIQAQFSIIGLSVSPTLANISIRKGQFLDVPVNLVNIGGSALSGLTFTPSASSGFAGSIINPGEATLLAGEKRAVAFRVSADANAPASGFASLAISTDQGLNNKLEANLTAYSAIPLIATSPSYIDTGIVRGTQRIESFTIRNTGMEVLKNARLEGPSLPWVTLTIDKTLGDIAVNDGKVIGLVIKPGETIAQGIYDDRIVIYSDNHIPYTYNIQITVTSSAVGSVQFTVINELMEHLSGASITLQNQTLTEIMYTLKTDAIGTAAKFDIPEGRYSFNVSAPGHRSYFGSFVIQPGLTATVPVSLEVNMVTVEWSVVPTTIQDKYEIKVTQTFETNVPTPVLVVEPPNFNVPDMKPGEVVNGEFTVTNYGLIEVYDVQVGFPTSFGDYDIEVLGSALPGKIGAMQKVVVPYRITRRVLAAGLYNQLGSYGGNCYQFQGISIKAKCVICPNSAAARIVEKAVNFILSFFMTCTGTGGNPTCVGDGCVGTPIIWGGGGGVPGGGGPGSGGSPGSNPSPLPTGDCGCMNCDDHNPCTDDSCSNGACVNTPKTCDNSDPCVDSFCGATGCDTKPKNCDKGDPCKDYSCGTNGCEEKAKNCDDGDPCTDDSCGANGCVHTPKNCDDGIECTVDKCNQGVCEHTPIEQVPDDPTDCVDKVCIDGHIVDVADNNETPPQSSPNDCKKEVCRDKSVVRVDDDTEKPLEDCKICKNGAAAPAPDGQVLPDKPDDCVDKYCVGGKVENIPDDTEIPPQSDPHDCRKEICQAGRIVQESDDNEICMHDNNDCTDDYCRAGVCIHPANDASCDDEKYCTSFNGTSPGNDQCANKSCQGTPIKDKDLGFNNKVSFSFEIPELNIPVIKMSIPSFNITVDNDMYKIETCCEDEKKMAVNTKGYRSDGGGLGPVKLKIPIPEVANLMCEEVKKQTKGILSCSVNASVEGTFSSSRFFSVDTDCCKNKTAWTGSGYLTLDEGTINGSISLSIGEQELVNRYIKGTAGIRYDFKADGLNMANSVNVTKLTLEANPIIWGIEFAIKLDLGPYGPYKFNNSLPELCH